MNTEPQAPEFPNALRQRLFFLHIGYIVTGCVGVISSWAAFGWPIFLSFLTLVMGVIGCVRLVNETNLSGSCCCTARDFARPYAIAAAVIAFFGFFFAVCGVVSLVWVSNSAAFHVFAVLAILSAVGMVGCAIGVYIWVRDLDAQLKRCAGGNNTGAYPTAPPVVVQGVPAANPDHQPIEMTTQPQPQPYGYDGGSAPIPVGGGGYSGGTGSSPYPHYNQPPPQFGYSEPAAAPAPSGYVYTGSSPPPTGGSLPLGGVVPSSAIPEPPQPCTVSAPPPQVAPEPSAFPPQTQPPIPGAISTPTNQPGHYGV